MFRLLAVVVLGLGVASCVDRGRPPVPTPTATSRPRPRPTATPRPALLGTRCHYADAGGVAKNVSLTPQVISARGTTCTEAKRVFRAASRWMDPNDYEHLGAPRHPLTLGYRCRAYLVGDSYWHLRCERGDRVLYAAAAE